MSARAFARRRRWGPIAVLAACFAHNLYASWLTWGDLCVDTGREWELPRRIAEGAALYADLRYYYGPFAPYFNGFLYKLFGAHHYVLCAAGATSAALMCLVLYRLARQFVDRASATLAAAAFLYLCGFAHLNFYSIFNFVLPYTFAATYGMLFAATSLLFLARHASKRRAADLALSLAALVLAAFCKVEAFVPAFGAHAAFLAYAFFEKGRLNKAHLLGYACAVAAVLGGYGAIAARVGFDTLVHDNLAGAVNERAGEYIGRVSGLAVLGDSLLYMGASALACGALLFAARVLARGGGNEKAGGWRAAVLFVLGAGLYGALPVAIPFRALSLGAGALLAVLGWRGLTAKDAAARAAALPPLLLWAFTLGACARTPLRVVAFHYGFFLLPVGLVALAWAFGAWLPREKAPAHRRRLARFAGCGMLLGLIFAHARISHGWYGAHKIEYESPRGRLRLVDYHLGLPVGDAQKRTLQLLETLPPGTKVLALPQGLGLNFFTGHANPYAMFSYLPMEWSGSWDDQKIVAMWAANPPDVVLRMNYGIEHGVFGIHYAQEPWEWLRAHVERRATVGLPGQRPVVEIYARPGVIFGPVPAEEPGAPDEKSPAPAQPAETEPALDLDFMPVPGSEPFKP
ncbi:MAG: glycosyltransferase family 39 protein [Planctomycetes bacterium]|nr:glycosyltransferase family 39 protein [Planctomycetota bacterium]